MRDGATGDNTQICMPSVPMFANPHSAHEAIANPRIDREFRDVISFDARSSETCSITERGTPAKRKAHHLWRETAKIGVGYQIRAVGYTEMINRWEDS